MVLLCLAMAISMKATAQVDFKPVFTQVKLEARADFDYWHTTNSVNDSIDSPYGFHGRYFNFVVSGTLSEKFSYFFRQRIIAQPGSVSLFDNTDFLYITYMPTKNWMFRFGKDALAVGGFEYDASPIDVLFSTTYWNNFYCFQPAVAGAYKSNDGSQMFLAQVGNSPYVYYGAPLGFPAGSEWKSGLMAYNLYYSGNFGHFHMLHSVNMFERPDHNYMNYIALGFQMLYDKWDVYLDLIHHANSWDDWGNNFAIVSCANWLLTPELNFFVKGAYEQNMSDKVIPTYGQNGLFDILLDASTEVTTYGMGVEYRPASCPDFRLHAFVANRRTMSPAPAGVIGDRMAVSALNANIGITWKMDIHRMFKKNNLTMNE